MSERKDIWCKLISEKERRCNFAVNGDGGSRIETEKTKHSTGIQFVIERNNMKTKNIFREMLFRVIGVPAHHGGVISGFATL